MHALVGAWYLMFNLNAELKAVILKHKLRIVRLSYQAMSSSHTQSQLCTATLISSLVHSLDYISAILFVSRHVYFN